MVAQEFPTASNIAEASQLNRRGLALYGQWDMDRSIQAFKDATANDPNNPEYHINLARAFARAGNYPDARKSLVDYLQLEKGEVPADRYDRLFSSALDAVESRLIEGMGLLKMPVQLTGKAIQMWLEYRLTIGRQPILLLERPGLWASALVFLTSKINSQDVDRQEIAALFRVEVEDMKDHCDLFVKTLDLVTADNRYFIGDKKSVDDNFEDAQQKNYLGGELQLEK